MQFTDATLQTLPAFRNLDPETFGALESISRLIDVPGEAILSRQGSPAESMHYLLDGQVALTRQAPNGDVTVIDVLRPVRSFGLPTIVTGESHQMTAQALTMSRLLEIRAAPLRNLLGLRPTLATTLLQGLSLDLRAVTRQVIDLKLRTATQRLGCYLLRQVKDVPGNSADIRLPVQKRLLAGQIGCRQENLSRAFAALRDYGVETHGSRVILHDIDRLRRYSLPDEGENSEAAPPLLRSARAFSDAFKLS